MTIDAEFSIKELVVFQNHPGHESDDAVVFIPFLQTICSDASECHRRE